MSRELITVSVGQCGNQVGAEFWRQLCAEHGLAADGRVLSADDAPADGKDTMFYQADDDHWVPRAVLLDTEPGVLKAVQGGRFGRLFNHESVYVAGDGSGAGNNWAMGYTTAQRHADKVCDMVDREAEVPSSP